MSPFVLAGVAGFGFYALSFALVQINRMDGNGANYTLMNTIAAALVLASMGEQFNLGSLLTQVSWIGIGIVGLARRWWPRTEEEAESAEVITLKVVPPPRELTA